MPPRYVVAIEWYAGGRVVVEYVGDPADAAALCLVVQDYFEDDGGHRSRTVHVREVM